ncbi:hypothetical protein IWW38_000855 [Coemansia aciculifera]|uniref:Uncharacterized protein n=1 Tax=Coemansia aciculifera TaxID=417176 RepID=A0ACC1M8H8_9FUNG|nr:hypothetical protein IWW38_000855 [Coemansia aciculifera]
MSLPPTSNNNNNNTTVAAPAGSSSAMSPLHIGFVEGLTEQQTAEMVELLTPFLSPATTPSFNASSIQQHGVHSSASRRAADEASRAYYSPLTSPMLVSQHSGNTSFAGPGNAADQYQMSMPPPSPLITAEHIMRRQQMMQQQQQQQQHSPSFPSVSSPYIAGANAGGARNTKRRGSVSSVALMGGSSGSHLLGSPQYHPYRNNQPPPLHIGNGGGSAAAMRSPHITMHQLNHNNQQLTYTPSLLSRTSTTADTDSFFLDSITELPQQQQHHLAGPPPPPPPLPQSQQAATRNRTLHQLNASPQQFSNGSSLFDTNVSLPTQQRSISLNSSALAMFDPNNNNNAGSGMVTAEQLNSWLDGGDNGSFSNSGSQPTTVAANHSDRQSATPASLMNLPLSAHHLPHSANGEIVSSSSSGEGTHHHHHHHNMSPGPPTATSSAMVSAFGKQQITTASGTVESADLLQFVTQSAPMTEFVHPPLPPPLHIGPSSSNDKRQMRRKSIANESAKPTASSSARGSSNSSKKGLSSAAGKRRSRTSLLLSPHQTPLVPSTLKHVTSPGFSPYSATMASPGLAPLTPSTLAPRRILSSQMSTPTMGPLIGRHTSASVTPQMRPHSSMIAATSTTNIVGLEADVVTRLATKSNYQNIMEGNSEFLGLSYKSEFKSGLERRRTNHKQAEQKRRDSLKTCFQALEKRLPDLDPKLVSKIYLLNRANAFIDSLTKMNQLLVAAAEEQGIDVAAIAAQAQASAANCDDEDEDEEGEEEQDEYVFSDEMQVDK